MRHFDETKPFGTAMVGAVALGIGYQAGLTDWIALFSLPVAITPQQSWGFEGEPPKAVLKDLGILRILGREIGLYEVASFSCN